MIRLAIAIALFLAAPAAADEINAALTEQQVQIDQGFAGARIVLYGAFNEDRPAEEARDLIVIVRGPTVDLEVRAKKRVAGLWVPGAPVLAQAAPSFYFAASTRPLADILDRDQRRRRQLGADFLDVSLAGLQNVAAAADRDDPGALFSRYRLAFIESMVRQRLYRDGPDAVELLEGNLFRAEIELPANTPVGYYRIQIYLVKDGAITAVRSNDLYVAKVGLERRIFDLAHDFPLLYGLFCVAVSLFAGWLAAMAFRK